MDDASGLLETKRILHYLHRQGASAGGGKSGGKGGRSWVRPPTRQAPAPTRSRTHLKVFHPGLPPDGDGNRSWSDDALLPDKPECPGGTMACAFTANNSGECIGSPDAPCMTDADHNTTDLAIQRLQAWKQERAPLGQPFLLAVGYQSPRLSWSAPADVLARFPPAAEFPLPRFPQSPPRHDHEHLEWFRPVEITGDYSDMHHSLNHSSPMSKQQQQEVCCMVDLACLFLFSF